MAFYFRTDGPYSFSASNPASTVVPTNGISVYIAGSPGSRSFTYNNDSWLEVYFDDKLYHRYRTRFENVNDEFVFTGDLNISASTNGNSLIITTTPVKIPADAQTMLIKASALQNGGTYTDYQQSYTFNSPPEISGSDSDLGVKNSSFTVDFSVDDANSSDILSVVGYLNDEIIYNGDDLQRGKTYSVDITNAMLSGLEIGKRNEIMFEVSDTKATVRRIYSFTKERDLETYCEYVTEPIMTASKPNCITVAQGVKCYGGVDVKVYVTNNALDNNPSWEDMTAEFNRSGVYYFANKVCNSDRWAIALRFVNAKVDSNTEMVVSGFGFMTDVIVIVDDGLPRQLSGFKSGYTFGNTHTLTWTNPDKNFTATKIVRAKNWTPLTVDDGDVVYDGVNTSITDTVDPFDDTYFNPETYWTMIDNKDYSYWTNVALNKPSGKIIDGDMYVYRKFPYGNNGVQTQEYNGVVNVVIRGVDYPYPEGSITVDKTYSDEHGSIDIPVLDHIPGNVVRFDCTRDSRLRDIVRGEFVEETGALRFSAVHPGISEITAHTGAFATETKATIKVCDRLHLKINTMPSAVYGNERNLVTYNVTNSLNENLTDKCLLHYASESNMLDENFEVNVLGGGNAEIVFVGSDENGVKLSKYYFWVEIDGSNYEEEGKIYLRSYGIEV